MKKYFLLITGLCAIISIQFGFAGEECVGSKKDDASLKSIKLGEFATKEDKLKVYKEKYNDISFNELKKAIKKGDVVIIDANGKESFEKNHITSAIAFHDKESLEKVLPSKKDVLIITYCGGPKCAAWTTAADYVSARGYTNVTHYSEGIKGWIKRIGK